MVSGKAKILTGKKKKKAVVNNAISSKVPTLHPKPNTLLGIYRENLFPQQPSTVKVFVVAACTNTIW